MVLELGQGEDRVRINVAFSTGRFSLPQACRRQQGATIAALCLSFLRQALYPDDKTRILNSFEECIHELQSNFI